MLKNGCSGPSTSCIRRPIGITPKRPCTMTTGNPDPVVRMGVITPTSPRMNVRSRRPSRARPGIELPAPPVMSLGLALAAKRGERIAEIAPGHREVRVQGDRPGEAGLCLRVIAAARIKATEIVVGSRQLRRDRERATQALNGIVDETHSEEHVAEIAPDHREVGTDQESLAKRSCRRLEPLLGAIHQTERI